MIRRAEMIHGEFIIHGANDEPFWIAEIGSLTRALGSRTLHLKPTGGGSKTSESCSSCSGDVEALDPGRVRLRLPGLVRLRPRGVQRQTPPTARATTGWRPTTTSPGWRRRPAGITERMLRCDARLMRLPSPRCTSLHVWCRRRASIVSCSPASCPLSAPSSGLIRARSGALSPPREQSAPPASITRRA